MESSLHETLGVASGKRQRKELMADNITTVSSESWENDVLKSDLPVLVDFWAAWCGPCKMVAPVLDELAVEMGEKVRVAKLNVDENQEIDLHPLQGRRGRGSHDGCDAQERLRAADRAPYLSGFSLRHLWQVRAIPDQSPPRDSEWPGFWSR
jgi:thiol-disulfide isomerase/thioredoxin